MTWYYRHTKDGGLEIADGVLDFTDDDWQRPNNYMTKRPNLADEMKKGRVSLEEVRRVDMNEIREPNSCGATPLWYAARDGYTDIAKYLLSCGVSVSCHGRVDGAKYGVDTVCLTPLHYASRNGKLEICRMLVEHGAEINEEERRTKCTPVFLAACGGWDEVIDFLVKSGADIEKRGNQKDLKNVTPLCVAAAKGFADAVRVLLEHGATGAKEAVEYARKGQKENPYNTGYTEVLKMLTEGLSPKPEGEKVEVE